MYKPLFNTVLVEIDDKESKWGKGNDDSLGGEVFREGKVIETPDGLTRTDNYPWASADEAAEWAQKVADLKGKTVMWNEGHEAGTVFEEDGKKYALLYWFDLRGVKDEQ